MSAVYYVCGGCGRYLPFGPPLREHRCKGHADPIPEAARVAADTPKDADG